MGTGLVDNNGLLDAELAAALTPILADLTHATSLTPEFRVIDWPMPGTVATMLFFGFRSAGVWVNKWS